MPANQPLTSQSLANQPEKPSQAKEAKKPASKSRSRPQRQQQQPKPDPELELEPEIEPEPESEPQQRRPQRKRQQTQPKEESKETSDSGEDQEEEEEEYEPPPPKSKRARAASAKPPAKSSTKPVPKPLAKPPSRSRKAKDVKETPKASPAKSKSASSKSRSNTLESTPTPSKSKPTPSKSTPTPSKSKQTPSKSTPTPLKSSSSPSTPMEFNKLKISHVIDDSITSKTITFQGIYEGETTVIRLEKTLFDEEAMKKALGDEKTLSTLDFTNDVYSSYLLNPSEGSGPLNDIKATVVCPANETVLAKYSRADMIFFSETPDTYTKVVEPFIENKVTNEKDYNQWVFNILDGKSEVDRIILNDPDPDSGFMIAPNLKSTGEEQDIKLVAICHRRDIRSLRDLNDKHLTLLKNILTKGTKVIKAKFKKSKGQLRSYVHYHPSFYHFHVHFRMVDPSAYESSDRDNLLSTIINNITLNKDYYKKSTLTYPLSKNTALFHELKKAKRII